MRTDAAVRQVIASKPRPHHQNLLMQPIVIVRITCPRSTCVDKLKVFTDEGSTGERHVWREAFGAIEYATLRRLLAQAAARVTQSPHASAVLHTCKIDALGAYVRPPRKFLRRLVARVKVLAKMVARLVTQHLRADC